MKVIFILVDGMRYDTAVESLGYLNNLVEKGLASRYKIRTETPSISRPMYETVLTGTTPSHHLITSNDIVRLSKEKSIFHIARENNLTTGAAAYYWMSELYNRAPFNKIEDLIQLDTDKPIQHGIYYFDDEYPDSHLFIQAEYIIKKYNPDFMLIHPMGVDNAGHKFGGKSHQYRVKVLGIDIILSAIINEWLSDKDTCVIVTSDHGMTADSLHGGTTADERTVPLFLMGQAIKEKNVYENEVSQLLIAPTVCKLLNVSGSEDMIKKTLFDIKE